MATGLIAQPNALTLSGGLITDTTRTTGTEGDGATVPGGIGVWEATTNIFAAACSTWAKTNCTAVADAAAPKFGTDSTKITSSGAGVAQVLKGGVVTGAPLARLPYALGAWVTGVGATIGKTVTLQYNESGGGFGDAAVVSKTLVLTATAQWVAGAATMAQSDRTGLYTLISWTAAGAGEVIYVDGEQFEQKAIATPFAGYGASRTAGRLQASAALVSATQGGIGFRFIAGANSIVSQTRIICDLRNDAYTDGFLLYHNGTYFSALFAGGGAPAVFSAAIPLVAGTVYTGIVKWQGGNVLSLSVNAASFSSTTARSSPMAAFPSSFDIGRERPAAQNWWNGAFLSTVTFTGTATNADAATIQTLLAAAAARTALPAYPSSLGVTAIWPGVDATLWVPGTITRLTGDLRVGTALAARLAVSAGPLAGQATAEAGGRTMIRNSIHRLHLTNLRDADTGVLATSAETVCKAQIANAAGTTTYAETAMTYVGPGEWTIDTPASAVVAGADPWTPTVIAYDVAGTTPRLTLQLTARDVLVLDV